MLDVIILANKVHWGHYFCHWTDRLKKRKKKREKNYFSCFTICRFKANSNSKHYKIINKNSSLENYKAKRWPRTRDHNYFTVFMQFRLYSPCPVKWNISGRPRNCMELSLWEYKWNTHIFKDKQHAQKNNVIWDATKYIKKYWVTITK